MCIVLSENYLRNMIIFSSLFTWQGENIPSGIGGPCANPSPTVKSVVADPADSDPPVTSQV